MLNSLSLACSVIRANTIISRSSTVQHEYICMFILLLPHNLYRCIPRIAIVLWNSYIYLCVYHCLQYSWRALFTHNCLMWMAHNLNVQHMYAYTVPYIIILCERERERKLHRCRTVSRLHIPIFHVEKIDKILNFDLNIRQFILNPPCTDICKYQWNSNTHAWIPILLMTKLPFGSTVYMRQQTYECEIEKKHKYMNIFCFISVCCVTQLGFLFISRNCSLQMTHLV